MKLGNSGGNNKGKKYLVIKGNEPITEENQIKGDAFNDWFAREYGSLRKNIKFKDTSYDDEIFHETYLRIINKILLGGLEINDYASYFHRSYFTNKIQLAIKENRFVDFDMERFQGIDETEENIGIMKKQEMLSIEIIKYVQETWPEDYKLFKLSLEEGLTLPQVAEITGVKVHVVQRKLSLIKNQIKRVFENKIPKQDGRKTKKAKDIYNVSPKATLEDFSQETPICIKEPKAVVPKSSKVIEPVISNLASSESEIILQLINEKKVVLYSMYEDLLLMMEKQQQNLFRLQNILQMTANNLSNTLNQQL